MSRPIFLLGAGFNCDAAKHTRPVPAQSIYIGKYEIGCSYPLREELARLCFGEECAGDSDAIEEKFARAIGERDWTPLKKLYDALMKADYYLPHQLLPDGRNPANPYARFFDRFRGCHILTFNYDSLPEIFLLHAKAWSPRDGYGVTVKVDPQSPSLESKSYVLHLHGSLCIYACRYDSERRPGSTIQWLVPKETPTYVFDPHSIADRFSPYKGIPAGISYEPVEARVVAPVPDKAREIDRPFIQAVGCLADQLLGSCSGLVVIGYSFNEADEASYEHLLQALSRSPQPQAEIICPEAAALSRRLAMRYPAIRWTPHRATFEEWVDAGFPGSAY